ncbi:MAG TPA: monovalent cation/H+ antiporter subunit D family protein [Gammaproteobacteria bacterium]|nr:monovalent cation/H+ antiporter subunit D family protein [Gammaproteobacteria bacterium]
MIEASPSLLLVAIPLLAAPVTALLPAGRLPWLMATAVAWICLALAVWQLQTVAGGNVVSYELGGWAPPWGIEYRVDALNALVALIIAGIAAVTLPYALRSVEREIPRHQRSLFYAAFLLCMDGMLGISQTGDVFNLFVFLEISSLSSYALISLGQRRQALTAAYQYLVMGTIGATFLLIGIGLIYAETGTLNMMDLHTRLSDLASHRTVHTGFAFIVVGIGLKLAMFPLHLWLPNVYCYAPIAVTVFLAATATKVAVYIMLRMVFTVFPGSLVALTPTGLVFLLLGVSGVLFASVAAIYQPDARRLLAYSSIGQIGYMVLGIAYGSALGLTATIVHVFNHALMKGALFMALGALVYRIGSSRLDRLAGSARQMPWTFGAIVIAGLSLVGVPGTAGFISKWYLVLAALEQQDWLIALVVLAGSLLAVAYLWKLVDAMLFRTPAPDAPPLQEAPLSMLVPAWLLVLANIWFGLDTRLTVDTATTAVRLLTVTGP